MIKKKLPWLVSIGVLALLAMAATLAPGRAPAIAVAAPAEAGLAAAALGAGAMLPHQQTGDPADDTTFATVDLSAGFIMDPYLLPVIGAGDTPASDLVAGCNGFVDTEPDVVVNWSGETEQLSFFVYSDGDAVLAVELPDGSVLCNDDAGLRTVDPLVVIETPAEGAYRVHVGTARKGEPALGFLAATATTLDEATLAGLDLRPMLTRRERPAPQPLPRVNLSSLLLSRAAIFGSADLAAGFDTVQTFAAGGGDIAAFQVEEGELVCAGYVSMVPSYSFTWSGEADALRLFFEANKDSSLAVVTPDRQVLCNMNAGENNANPALSIDEPVAGEYDVYIASMAPDSVVAGRLTITGDLLPLPGVLAPAAQ